MNLILPNQVLRGSCFGIPFKFHAWRQGKLYRAFFKNHGLFALYLTPTIYCMFTQPRFDDLYRCIFENYPLVAVQ